MDEIVYQYQESIKRILQLRRAYTLSGSIGTPTKELQREPDSSKEDSSLGPSKTNSTTGHPPAAEEQSHAQTQMVSSAGKPYFVGQGTTRASRLIEQATPTPLPAHDSSGGKDSADMFDPLTFELSSFAASEFELSVFASPLDFELSVVAQQLIHSMPDATSTLDNSQCDDK